MKRLHCLYNYKSVDSIIASWILRRKYNGVDLVPYSIKDGDVPYIYAKYRTHGKLDTLVYMGVEDYPFDKLKLNALIFKKMYIFTNNQKYINNYYKFKDVIPMIISGKMNTEESLSKMSWKYIFPDVKVPIFVELMNSYFMKGENLKIGDFFKNKIVYITDMKEEYIRKKDFSDILN